MEQKKYVPVWQTWRMMRSTLPSQLPHDGSSVQAVNQDNFRKRAQMARIERQMRIDELAQCIGVSTTLLADFERDNAVLDANARLRLVTALDL